MDCCARATGEPLRTALGVAAVLLAGCAVPAGPAPSGPWPDGPIVAFGDSYTEGRGSRSPSTQSYPAVMQANLGIPMLNKGITGQTAAEALPRLARDTWRHEPRLVVVEFGVNEAFRGQDVKDCLDALDRMLTDLRGRGIPVVLVGVHFAHFQEAFDAGLTELARKHDAGLVLDVLRGVLDDPRHTDDGGYHPNAAGYAIMESRVRPEVERVLVEPAS